MSAKIFHWLRKINENIDNLLLSPILFPYFPRLATVDSPTSHHSIITNSSDKYPFHRKQAWKKKLEKLNKRQTTIMKMIIYRYRCDFTKRRDETV